MLFNPKNKKDLAMHSYSYVGSWNPKMRKLFGIINVTPKKKFIKITKLIWNIKQRCKNVRRGILRYDDDFEIAAAKKRKQQQQQQQLSAFQCDDTHNDWHTTRMSLDVSSSSFKNMPRNDAISLIGVRWQLKSSSEGASLYYQGN